MSHTPAPWNCEIPDIGDPQSEDERGNKYWEVTPIPQRFENNEYLCITGWMSEANARLIAAAPDLLAALNDINNWLVCAPIATADDMAQSFTHMQFLAESAISKATNA